MSDRAGKPNTPYGGKLIDLLAKGDELVALKAEASKLADWVVTPRQSCDLEMLLNGGFSPLTGFMNEKDYNSVVDKMTLADGTVWTMPITFDASKAQADSVKVGSKIALREPEGHLLAILDIQSIWKPDKLKEAKECFAGLGEASDIKHPAINYLLNQAGEYYVGGSIRGAALPTHYDFPDMRRTPAEVRQLIIDQCWLKIVGFQTRNPMHKSHRELTLRAAKQANANVLIHPVVGMTKPGDVDHFTRVRCYREILKTYPRGMATISLLPIAMRMAGPREAVWHAIIRRNYGCTHFIVGRDHAGPGKGKDGKDFYDVYGAQELVAKFQDKIGVQMLKFQHVVYVADKDTYMTKDEVPEGERVLHISGTELRRRLYAGIKIPEWFSYPSVVKILQQRHKPKSTQGFTIYFTGLSGSGKSTIANALRTVLLEDGRRAVTLLDGDHVRRHLSTELGFSKDHRDLNVKRIGFVASLVTKSGGVAICAQIAPYRKTREYCRQLIEKEGGFIEVHIATSLAACEKRDVKGLYKKAREGIIKNFTGISDPYEAPISPELVIDTEAESVRRCVQKILLFLEQEKYIVSSSS